MILGPRGDMVSDVAVFQEFWGSKAELRRFQDGAILWSVGNEMKKNFIHI